MSGEVWVLGDGRRAIAELVVDGGDFPWLHARVVRLPGFEAVAPLFEAELELTGSLGQDDAWAEAYEQVRSATTLTEPDGTPVPEYLLHIEADRAWWRWSETPFDG